MTVSHARFVVVLVSLLCAAMTGSPDVACGATTLHEAGRSGDDADWPVQQELRSVLALAEETRAGLKLALDRNDKLEQLLEQTRRELHALRAEVNRLSGGSPAEREPPVPVPELPERLARIEDRVDMNSAQIKEQAQTKVESESRYGVSLFGTVLYNAFYNSHDAAENAVPVAAPASSVRIPNGGGNFGATLRQTSLGFTMSGPAIAGARLTGDVEFDFYGGTDRAYGTAVLGALRMRTAAARLDGEHNSLALGLLEPIISPLSPASIAAVYYPALGESGNLWQWLPQTVLEHRTALTESASVIVQGGIITP